MMRKIVPILCCLIMFKEAYAQQAPVYSQYVLNEFIINPAMAGIDGMTSINLTGRKQWLGMQYAPESYSACVSGRILKSPASIINGRFNKANKGRVALGAAFVSDKSGALMRTNFQFSYAYHIHIRHYQLSFGLKSMLTQFKIDGAYAGLRDQADPQNSSIGKSAYTPDVGLGVNLSGLKGSIGLTANHLFESPVKFGDSDFTTNEAENIRMYLVYGLYKVKIKENWMFEPSILLRSNEQLYFSADVSGRFIYDGHYWGGVSFRTSKEFVLLLGVKLKRFYVGYSIDYGFNQLSYRSFGSHEVVMALKLGDSSRRYRWVERY